MSLKWTYKLIGLVLLIFIFYFLIDFNKLILVFSQLKWTYPTLALLILLAKTPANPYRWHYLLKKFSVKYSFKKLFSIFYFSILSGLITPSRIGEIFFRTAAIKKEGAPLNKSLISVILDRLTEFFFLVIASLIGILFFISLIENQTIIWILLCLFLGILIGFLLIQKNLIKKLFLFLLPKKNKSSVDKYLTETSQLLKKFNFKDYLAIFSLTAITWFFILIAGKILLIGLGINSLPFGYFLSAVFLSRLVGLLPISIAGLGTREATLIYLFSFFNIAEEKTIIFSLSLFLLEIISIALINLYLLLKPNRVYQ